MVVTFDSLGDAQTLVPARAGYSVAAAAVMATLEATFGVDVAESLRPLNEPLATVPPRVAMKAVIGGVECTLYADPRAINVLTPGINADSHLRACALHGGAVVASPSPRRGGNPSFAGIRYALGGPEAQEIADAEVMADEAAGRRPRRSLLMSATDRRAIEERAVRVATDYFESLGFQVADVGAFKSYDLDCRRDEEHLYVEVKGTTSGGDAIILTKNEVELHRAAYPNNALAIVRRIDLERSGGRVVASGGELVVTTPWHLDEAALAPLSYRYATEGGI
ncbi:protein NO VEIN domain-containing protein [Puerhibacterium sp. TATVAM-FAB25]|uniref:protein NO VEIN domain-containing protein n=1 Tax=Puerhibacterium sp. TATVAM-FAB25 TaxID=3093699 RepID=UPI003978547D